MDPTLAIFGAALIVVAVAGLVLALNYAISSAEGRGREPEQRVAQAVERAHQDELALRDRLVAEATARAKALADEVVTLRAASVVRTRVADAQVAGAQALADAERAAAGGGAGVDRARLLDAIAPASPFDTPAGRARPAAPAAPAPGGPVDPEPRAGA